MEVWSDRGSTCKFRNARSAFRNLLVDPLSLHTSMRNKQVEFNPYIYTLTTLSKLKCFGYKISVFLIQNTRSLFYGHHYSSLHRLMSLQRKLNVKIVLMFIVAENTGSVNIFKWTHSKFLKICQMITDAKMLLELSGDDELEKLIIEEDNIQARSPDVPLPQRNPDMIPKFETSLPHWDNLNDVSHMRA